MHLNTNEKNTLETLCLFYIGMVYILHWSLFWKGWSSQLLLNQFCKINPETIHVFYVGSWKIITSIKYPPWPFQAWTLSSCCESLFILHLAPLCCYLRDLLWMLTEVRLNVCVTLGVGVVSLPNDRVLLNNSLTSLDDICKEMPRLNWLWVPPQMNQTLSCHRGIHVFG